MRIITSSYLYHIAPWKVILILLKILQFTPIFRAKSFKWRYERSISVSWKWINKKTQFIETIRKNVINGFTMLHSEYYSENKSYLHQNCAIHEYLFHCFCFENLQMFAVMRTSKPRPKTHIWIDWTLHIVIRIYNKHWMRYTTRNQHNIFFFEFVNKVIDTHIISVYLMKIEWCDRGLALQSNHKNKMRLSI